MNIQALRYIIEIEHIGSINKASQHLYVSQSTLSRAIKEVETQIGMALFHRTSKGVVATYDGKKFIEHAQNLLQNIDELESRYFTTTKSNQDTLLVATQRCTPVIDGFIQNYQKYCQDRELLNLALQEDTTENIIRMVCNRIYGVGILHYTSDLEESFLRKCKSMDLEWQILDRSPVVVQLRVGHPLAQFDTLTVDMLAPYPHITFSDEDITSINYCSDVSQYNPSILKKRIVIQDRGTLRQIIDQTDGYYIGCDFSRFPYRTGDSPRKYIPLRDVDYTLNTLWIQRKNKVLTKPENNFLMTLKAIYEDSRF